MAVLEWLVRLLNLSFDMGVVPMAWHGPCIVPLYKGGTIQGIQDIQIFYNNAFDDGTVSEGFYMQVFIV